jgi:Putative MetA-pathway of phenol degradation
MKVPGRKVRAAMVAGLLWCSAGQAGTLDLGLGVDYATGKYGEPQTTQDIYVPFSVAYREGAWKAKLVVPFLYLRGNGEVIGGPRDRLVDDRRTSNSGSGSSNSGSGSSNSGKGSQSDDEERAEDAAGSATTSDSGLGDVVAAITYAAIARESSGFFLDLTGRVKFGTASQRAGLGTGENDYSFLVDLDQDAGAWTFSAGLGYTWIGSPEGFAYRNVMSATAGVGYRLGGVVSVNTNVVFKEASRSGAPRQLDIAPGMSFRLGERRRASVYLLFGLEDGSPDFGAGVSYTLSF